MNTAINLLIRIFLRFNNTQGMYRGTAACTTNILYKYRVLYELIILTNSFLLFFFFFLFPLSFLFFLPHRERERESINNEVRGCTRVIDPDFSYFSNNLVHYLDQRVFSSTRARLFFLRELRLRLFTLFL